MSFFDEAPAKNELGPNRSVRESLPSWRYPPTETYLPSILPWTRILGRSSDGCIALEIVRCWPQGLSLDLDLFVNASSPLSDTVFHQHRLTHGESPSPGRFRAGVLYPDGRRAIDTLPDEGISPKEGGNADHLILLRQGSSGTHLRTRQTFYLSPLPPPGKFKLIVAWTDLGIPDTESELDGTEVLRLATHAMSVW